LNEFWVLKELNIQKYLETLFKNKKKEKRKERTIDALLKVEQRW
jgi:hypothetical protein